VSKYLASAEDTKVITLLLHLRQIPRLHAERFCLIPHCESKAKLEVNVREVWA